MLQVVQPDQARDRTVFDTSCCGAKSLSNDTKSSFFGSAVSLQRSASDENIQAHFPPLLRDPPLAVGDRFATTWELLGVRYPRAQ